MTDSSTTEDRSAAGPEDASPGTAASGTGTAPADAPNILFAVVDSLRADAVFASLREESVLSAHPPETPTLDRLAEEGVAFTSCFAQGISTGPSMTAMLTGRYPLEYGGHWYLEDDQPTFAEEFAAAGYRTGAIHSNPYVSSGRNFDKGFETFDEDVVDFEPDRHLEGLPDKVLRLTSRVARLLRKTPYTPITEVNDRMVAWVDGQRPGGDGEGHDDGATAETGSPDDRPWFLWTQYMDVHGPYLPGGDFSYYNKLRAEWLWRKAAVRDPDAITDAEHEELLDNYRKEVEFFDDEFGRLLDRLDDRGELENTIVVVVGDHGDEFYEHGWYGHCNLPYDELTNVPLLVRFPASVDVEQGRRVDDIVRCVDILPTLADYAGVSFSETMRERMAGESLRPLLEAGTSPEFDCVVTEKKVWSGTDLRFGFRTDDTAFLYDLEADPGERTDVLDDHPEVAARFRERLEERIERIERTSSGVTIPDLDASTGVEERLRALGYK